MVMEASHQSPADLRERYATGRAPGGASYTDMEEMAADPFGSHCSLLVVQTFLGKKIEK